MTNDIYTDQRVRRVCEFLDAHNYDVTLVGRKLKHSKPLLKTSYKTKRFPLWFTKGAMFYATYNLRLFFYLLFHKTDVLLSNDLDTLYANHWAKKFKRNCKLVYDSHEYFIGVPELISNPKIQNFWRFIEKRTLPKADAMYTVNESIADLYRKEYQREIKVVRNISDAKKINLSLSKEELGLPLDKRVVIVQGAGINIDRGGEEMIEAIQYVENAILIFVGDGDVIPSLKEIVKKKDWVDKVKFFGKRPYEELMNFTKHSDVGISIDKDTNINYRFSLPNKVFDYINAGIPLLVSDLTEIKKIVEKYEIGLIIPNHQPRVIAEYLSEILDNPELYSKFAENTKTAAQELTWANECKVLEDIYCK